MKDWNEVLVHRVDIPNRNYFKSIVLKEPTKPETVKIIRMSDVEMTPVDWLWKPYLPFGKLSVPQGNPGEGKTYFAMHLAAAVRSVMFIGKLKHDPTMRILTHEKSSLAPPGVSLAFSLGDEGGFRWVGEYDITADEMLSGIEPQRETKTQQAKDLICTLLAGGKRAFSEDIDKAALERGIPGRTVRDAKRELGDALKSKIVEGRKKVFWME